MKGAMEYALGIMLIVILGAGLTLVMSRPLGAEVRSAVTQNANLLSQNFMAATNAVIVAPGEATYLFEVPPIDDCSIEVKNGKLVVKIGETSANKTLISYDIGALNEIECISTGVIKITKSNEEVTFTTIGR